MAGKPFAPIYHLALAEAARLSGRPAPRERVLCIGDGIVTDVKGASDQGLDCLFIANGIHGAEAVRDGRVDPILAAGMLAREGLHAAYAMNELRW
jgi:ribonucleotide monophosphatase NagD (HAD superfamily)